MTSEESESINVLLVAGHLSARGSCAYTLRLSKFLSDANIQATTTTYSADIISETEKEELEIQEHPYIGYPVISSIIQRDLIQSLEGQTPALVHAQTRAELPLGNRIAKALQVPLVVTVHDFLGNRDTFKLDRSLGHVIAVSDAVKMDLIRRANIDEDRISVIHSGVEVPDYVRKREFWPEKQIPVIGTIGALEEQKGQLYFLRAAKRVIEQGKDIEILIAGTGPDEIILRRQAEELEVLEHVTFVPYLNDLREALDAISIFCLPSLQQGLGIHLLEAMARGIPVIGTDVGGVSAIVRDDETGLIVPPHNSRALAQKIVDLLDNSELAKRISQSGKELVKESFSVETMVQKTSLVYRQLLESSKIIV